MEPQAFTERIRTIHGALLQGESICPWALEAARNDRIVYVDAEDFAEIQNGLKQISGNGGLLALVSRQDLMSHDAVDQWAGKKLEDLLVAAAVLNGAAGSVEVLRSEIRREMDQRRHSPCRVTLMVGNHPFFTFVTSPHYKNRGSEPFPRRSSHLVLWVAFVSDVKAVADVHPRAVAALSLRTQRAYGARYDADILVLPPQPPKERTCGSCNACCHTLAVSEIGKPPGTRCPHLRKSEEGCCKIYSSRPTSCHTYRCMWLQGNFERKDKPDRIGVVFSVVDLSDQQVVIAHVREPGAAQQGRAKQLIEDTARIVPVYVVYPDNQRRFYMREALQVRAVRWQAELETLQEIPAAEIKRT